MRSSEHLEVAEQYSRRLTAEHEADQSPVSSLKARIEADQGQALRTVLYHGFAAIVEAIKEPRS